MKFFQPEVIKRYLPEWFVAGIQRLKRLRREARRYQFSAGKPFFKEISMNGRAFSILIDPVKNAGVDEVIAETGVWEPHVVYCLEQLLQPGAVFLDIGANVGFHTLYAASIGETVTVHAFEPNSDVAAQLQSSIERNGFKNIVMHITGLSDQNSERILHVRDENTGGATLLDAVPLLDFRLHHSFPVTLVTLDSVCGALNRVDVIKIDIEGHEYEALKGGEELLKKYHPAILLEFSPVFYESSQKQKSEAFVDYLTALGYQFFVTETVQPINLYVWLSDPANRRAQIDIICARAGITFQRMHEAPRAGS